MNFYFVYDEYTDIADPCVANELATIVLENMKRDPHSEASSRPSKHILGEMTKQSVLLSIYFTFIIIFTRRLFSILTLCLLTFRFWERASTLASPGSPCFDHFISTSERYLRSVVTEAEDRAANHVRTLEEYFPLRRDTCGACPTLALIEFGLDLPEEVTSHPVVASLTQDAVDLIILVNVSSLDKFKRSFLTFYFIHITYRICIPTSASMRVGWLTTTSSHLSCEKKILNSKGHLTGLAFIPTASSSAS